MNGISITRIYVASISSCWSWASKIFNFVVCRQICANELSDLQSLWGEVKDERLFKRSPLRSLNPSTTYLLPTAQRARQLMHIVHESILEIHVYNIEKFAEIYNVLSTGRRKIETIQSLPYSTFGIGSCELKRKVVIWLKVVVIWLNVVVTWLEAVVTWLKIKPS